MNSVPASPVDNDRPSRLGSSPGSPSAALAIRLSQRVSSPTIRVDGRDIAPAADERQDYALACRVYRTSAGVSGPPEERWLRHALEG